MNILNMQKKSVGLLRLQRLVGGFIPCIRHWSSHLWWLGCPAFLSACGGNPKHIAKQFHDVKSWEAAALSRNHTSFPSTGWTSAAGNAGSSSRSITRCHTAKYTFCILCQNWWQMYDMICMFLMCILKLTEARLSNTQYQKKNPTWQKTRSLAVSMLHGSVLAKYNWKTILRTL